MKQLAFDRRFHASQGRACATLTDDFLQFRDIRQLPVLGQDLRGRGLSVWTFRDALEVLAPQERVADGEPWLLKPVRAVYIDTQRQRMHLGECR